MNQEKLDIIIGYLQRQDVTLKEHTQTLAEHTRILGEHSQTLAEHTRILGEHSQTLAEHTRILGEHSQILLQHSKMLERLDQETREIRQELKDTRLELKNDIGDLRNDFRHYEDKLEKVYESRNTIQVSFSRAILGFNLVLSAGIATFVSLLVR